MQRSNRHPRDEISPSESRLYLSLILPGEEEGKKKKEAVVLNHLETDKQQDCTPFNPTNRFFLLHRFILLIDERMRDTRRRGRGTKAGN